MYKSLPGERPCAHELIDIPYRRQRVITSGGEILTTGIERDTNAVGRMCVEGMLSFHIGVATMTGFIKACVKTNVQIIL